MPKKDCPSPTCDGKLDLIERNVPTTGDMSLSDIYECPKCLRWYGYTVKKMNGKEWVEFLKEFWMDKETEEKSITHTCFTCGMKYTEEGIGGVVCSYHDWTEGIFCTRCFKPRYLMGTDVARDEASTEIHCNNCLAKRKEASIKYKEMFLS